MIWAVVDTNVLVSGAIVIRGDSAFIVDVLKRGVTVVHPADFATLLREQTDPGDTL